MKRGDRIYINCGAYTHHGIDCGDGTVIHHPGGLDQKLQAVISRTSLSAFAAGRVVFVREYGKCDLPALVIERAESKLGAPGYNLFNNNCEHFATWCKTGIYESEQVRNVGAAAGGVSGSGVAVAAGMGVVSAAGAAAGLSGAGIMSGLATVGGIVGGGAVAGIGVLGAAPVVVTTMAMNQVFQEDESLTEEEKEARAVGRAMTTAGAVAGTAGAVGTVAAAGSVAGLSAAGITSGLAAVGATVGGGMAAGVVITVAAPAVAAAAIGYSAYSLWKWLSE
ncbi:lecithin retinol acyltransferase family protein [Chroococcidiopsis sp. CCALA 051]|uniref:lecithin retinol acyltransferase family protein n=1 Tax=Chroococcidiopsis sp. CCALA 051 TaxID=869949 RepID=UPI0018EB551C|nr:lecithin retinol acyltransferase family protein [Chroococcidiopsis sp. CCALA 051]